MWLVPHRGEGSSRAQAPGHTFLLGVGGAGDRERLWAWPVILKPRWGPIFGLGPGHCLLVSLESQEETADGE